MVKDYSSVAKEYIDKQWGIIKSTKETCGFIIPEYELPKTTNVIGFIETKLNEFELSITNSSSTELIEGLQTGRLKSIDVLLAFLHRSVIAQQLVNPITEFFIMESIKKAHELDDYFIKNGKPVGPLHGLPISIKDEFDLINQPTTTGLISQANSPRLDKSSPNIDILIKNGANIFVKTNVPTAVFDSVTRNNLFGKTLNPYNINFTSGGSSGGESALVALRGSPLGVGSDLGGSIRQPSTFNGLYGVKPSSGRVPHFSSKTVSRGAESLKPTNGCLANDLNALELYLKTVIDDKPWLKDTNVLPIPWNNDIKIQKKFKFAVLFDDGLIKPTPAISRALNLVKSKLVENGNEVIDWDIKNHYDLFEIAKFAPTFMSSNGFRGFKEEIGKTDELDLSKYDAEDLKVSKLWELQYERTNNVNEFWLKWNELGIDGLIMPVTALSGCKFDEFYDFTYSPLANVLDFPSIAFPVLQVDKNIDLKENIEFRTQEEETVWELYDPEQSDGVPIGLQILGPKLQEELTLELAKYLTELIR